MTPGETTEGMGAPAARREALHPLERGLVHSPVDRAISTVGITRCRCWGPGKPPHSTAVSPSPVAPPHSTGPLGAVDLLLRAAQIASEAKEARVSRAQGTGVPKPCATRRAGVVEERDQGKALAWCRCQSGMSGGSWHQRLGLRAPYLDMTSPRPTPSSASARRENGPPRAHQASAVTVAPPSPAVSAVRHVAPLAGPVCERRCRGGRATPSD